MSKQQFEAGFVDGFCGRALSHALKTARGQYLSEREDAEALKVLRDLPLSEIARRILAAKGMTAGAARFNAILGK